MTGTRTKTILAIGGHTGDMDLTAGPLSAEHILNAIRGTACPVHAPHRRIRRATTPPREPPQPSQDLDVATEDPAPTVRAVRPLPVPGLNRRTATVSTTGRPPGRRETTGRPRRPGRREAAVLLVSSVTRAASPGRFE
ncbi:hypothetical protein ACFVXW_05555 [Streptomyces sp. NPDC058251]|uniref:hypothetical protein n=1 Tax=Streptomyces sp. NPDC058251 TaxID=3346404 RepID=UPI0036EBAC66